MLLLLLFMLSYSVNAQSYTAVQSTFSDFKNNQAMLDLDLATDEDFQNFYDSIVSTNIGILKEIESRIANGDTLGADTLNEAITPGNDMESNEQSVNDILINKIMKNLPLSTGDSSALETIAWQHPLLGGKAVYIARAILFLEIHDETLESHAKINNHSIKDENDAQIDMYPNPTNGSLYFTGINSVTFAKIYNSQGRLVLTTKLFGNKLEVAKLGSGFYHLILYGGEDSHLLFSSSFAKTK